MHTAFIASFLANILLALLSFVVLPDRVAIHFSLGGAPDGWASNLTSTLLLLGTHLLVFLSLYLSPRLLTAAPRRWISLPNRDYWLTPEHRSLASARFSRLIWQFGTAVFLLMLVAGLLTLRANLADPVQLNEGALLTALVVFLSYTIFWTITLVRAFRIPPETNR